MSIFFLPDFIQDIKSLNNIKTLRVIMDKLINPRFKFIKKNPDDHRYQGIEDAWIRDVSKGNTAYRAIFIKKGEDVYFFRAGTKKIEVNLQSPDLSPAIGLTDFKVEFKKSIQNYMDLGDLLKSPEPSEVSRLIQSFFHVKLKSFWIFSPFLSKRLFEKNQVFGGFIDKAIEDDTMVTLFTLPPKIEDKEFFDNLESRGILIHSCPKLHAKIYYFQVDYESMNKYQLDVPAYRDTVILGSSNLTEAGIPFTGNGGNFEACFRIPDYKIPEATSYINYLENQSQEYSHLKFKSNWQ